MAVVTLSVDVGFVQSLRRRIGNIQDALVKSVDEQNRQNYEDARRLTGDRYISARELAAAGHPYSRRRPNPSVFPVNYPYILNRQSGRLYEAWGRTGVRRGRYITASTFNRTPYARFMSEKGTSRMIARPIAEHIVKTNQQQFKRRVAENVRKASRA